MNVTSTFRHPDRGDDCEERETRQHRHGKAAEIPAGTGDADHHRNGKRDEGEDHCAEHQRHVRPVAVLIGASVVHLPVAMSYISTVASTRVGSSPPTATIRPSMNAAP